MQKNFVPSLGLLLMIVVILFSPLPTFADKLTDTIIVSDDWNNQVLRDTGFNPGMAHVSGSIPSLYLGFLDLLDPSEDHLSVLDVIDYHQLSQVKLGDRNKIPSYPVSNNIIYNRGDRFIYVPVCQGFSFSLENPHCSLTLFVIDGHYSSPRFNQIIASIPIGRHDIYEVSSIPYIPSYFYERDQILYLIIHQCGLVCPAMKDILVTVDLNPRSPDYQRVFTSDISWSLPNRYGFPPQFTSIIYNPHYNLLYGIYNLREIRAIDLRGGLGPTIFSIQSDNNLDILKSMAVDPINGDIYVSRFGYNIEAQIPEEGQYTDIRGRIYCQGGSVYKLTGYPSPEISSVPVGPCPSEVFFNRDNQKVYVTNTNELSGNQPASVTYPNGEAHTVYVGCDQGSVSIVDTARMVEEQTIRLSPSYCPNDITYDHIYGNVYVSNSGITTEAWQVPIASSLSVISTVVPYITSLTTSIIDDTTHQDITGMIVPFGSSVHDTVARPYDTVDWTPHLDRYVPPVPKGKVSYALFDNADCVMSLHNGTIGPLRHEVVEIDDGGNVPPSQSVDLTFSPEASFQAHYSGDENYASLTSDCEPLPSILGPTINSTIMDDNNREVTSVRAGMVIHDTAGFSDSNGVIPPGMVTYQRFSTSDCGGYPVKEIVNVTDTGGIPNSSNVTASGNMSYMAVYNGRDPNLHWTDSGCEKIEVTGSNPIGLRILDQFGNDVTNGTVVVEIDARAVVTISEDLVVPGSTVTYQLFRGTGCGEADHNTDLDKKVNVEGSTTLPPSDPFHLTVPDAISYKAVYNGPSVSLSSFCESVISSDFPPPL